MPPVTQSMDAEVTEKPSIGTKSNTVTFNYTDDCDDVSFEKRQFKTPDVNSVLLTQPTAISIWADGLLYIETRVGIVQAVGQNVETLETTSFCYFEKLRTSVTRMQTG